MAYTRRNLLARSALLSVAVAAAAAPGQGQARAQTPGDTGCSAEA